MSELPIPAEARDAVKNSLIASEHDTTIHGPHYHAIRSERAFRAGLEAWGFEVEQCFVDGTDPYIGYRVISRWLPVEQERER